ncbi:MAG: hypothetical protein AB8B74_13525 [Crocinitomicaceae bacterium]
MTSVKESLKQPVFQQYALELVFPILGYLFFGWSFLIIVLFYLIDQFGNQVNFFARLRFVQTLYLPKKKWIFPLAIILFCIVLTIELSWIYNLFSNSIYDCTTLFFHEELYDFLISEFWLFLPILIIANYFKDKMTFYKTDLPYQESPEKMVITNWIGLVSTFLLITFVYGIWLIYKPAHIWLIVAIALLKLLYDVLIISFLKSRFLKVV